MCATPSFYMSKDGLGAMEQKLSIDPHFSTSFVISSIKKRASKEKSFISCPQNHLFIKEGRQKVQLLPSIIFCYMRRNNNFCCPLKNQVCFCVKNACLCDNLNFFAQQFLLGRCWHFS